MSSITSTGDGSTTDFAVNFPYLSKSHVKVSVDGVDTAFTWVNEAMIRVLPAPAGGTKILVQRDTPRVPQTSWREGAVILGRDLNNATLQSLFVAEEALGKTDGTIKRDASNVDWDAQGIRLRNLADPVTDQDAVNKRWAVSYVGSQFTAVQTATNAAMVAAQAAAANAQTAATSASSSAATALTKATALETAMEAFRQEYLAPSEPTAQDIIDTLGYTPASTTDLTALQALAESAIPNVYCQISVDAEGDLLILRGNEDFVFDENLPAAFIPDTSVFTITDNQLIITF